MKKRVLSMLLVLCVVVALLPTTVLAAEYNDTKGHWGEAAINQWTGYRILEGYNGKFSPDDDMTRAELATVIARLLGLTDTTADHFNDVPEGSWYEEYILKCRAAGIMQGYPGNTAHPDDPVSREETMVLIGRALGVTPVEGEVQFKDGNAVSDWAAPYVNAMTAKDYVKGFPDNTVAPQADINRASVAALLDQTISTYCNTSGDTVDVHATDERVTLIAAPNVTVTGNVANLVVATGKVEDGQENTVTVESTNVSGGLTVVSANTTVTLKTNTTVASAVLTETAEQSKIVVEQGAKVTDTLTVSAPKAEVSVAGEVKNVNVDKTATYTTVTGSGKVENVATSGDNTKIETSGTKVEVAEGTKGTTADDKEVPGGETVTTGPVVPPHTHTWVDGEVTKAATCTEEGSKTQTCSGCGATQNVTIPALGHNYENGFCTRCGDMVMTEGDTIDKALDFMIGYILNHQDVAVKDYILSVSAASENRNIVVDIADDKGEEDYQALKNALKDGWAFGDYGNLKYDTENGVAGLSAIGSVTVYNSDRTTVTIKDVPALLKKLDKAKTIEDLKTILREDVKPTTDQLHIDGINSSTKLGELVEVTAKDAIRICVTDKNGTPYYYTIVCK